MKADESPGTSLSGQVLALKEQVAALRESFLPQGSNFSAAGRDQFLKLDSSLQELAGRTVKLEEDLRNMQALADISRVVNSSLELDEVLRTVMDTIVRLTRAERGFLMLRDSSGEMVIRVARNWEKESIHASEFAISRTVVERVINDGQPVLTTNAQEDPRFGGQESIVAYNLRSILCVPLKVKSELIGVMYTDNRIRSGIFSETERDLLAAFANQAAIAIENARLFASVRLTLAEVTELKNLMDNVFASIASGVLTTNVQDQITLCNRAAESIFEQKTSNMIGQRLAEALPYLESDIHLYLQEVRKKEKQVMGLEISPTIPGRGTMDWRLNISPLKDANLVTQGVAIVLDDMTERNKLEAQRRLLERMVSPAVIAQIDPDDLQIGGQQVYITILFADVRGFTSYGENQSPEELVAVLNRYLAAGAEAVLAQEGTVDKFLGDGLMAWFNAPLPQPDHTLRAVKAGLALGQAVERLYSELSKEARLAFGVGIHYGEAVLGWIGTEKRLDFTAIGDSINTAKRIQENTAGNQILISKEAFLRVKDQVQARPAQPLHVKGKSEAVEVYEVLGLK